MKHVKPQHDWSEMHTNGYMCRNCLVTKEAVDDYNLPCPPSTKQILEWYRSEDRRSKPLLDRIMNYLGWERM